MQIILLEKVANVGNLGDVVEVKNGFARNFLIPQKKAKRATKASLAEFEARRAELERIQAEKLAAAQVVYGTLHEKTFEVSQKAGVDGRLFGSVTSQDIVDSLKKSGVSGVVKSQVRLSEGPLKSLGIFPVSISLHADVVAEVSIKVVADEA